MSTILRQIATLDRIERISFFETLFASGEEGRANFLLVLAYNIVNFTAANNRLWQTIRRVLEELRADFEAEGNTIIYETAMGETKRMDWGTGCRYLHLVSTERGDSL